MARQRIESVELPEGVQIVRKRSGKRYFYWAPRRSSSRPGERIALGSDPTHPDFWATLRACMGVSDAKGTFSALIAEYQGSSVWEHLRPASQKDYAYHLARIEADAGDKKVADLTKRDLYLWQDSMASTPATANHAVAIMKGLLEFAVRYEYRTDNPAVGMKLIETDVDGAHPWPEDGWSFIIEHGPTDLRRLAILGRATGQRKQDLIRMRPADRHLDGFNLRISKLRDKPHFIPLTQAELAEIDSWDVGRLDIYVKNARQQPFTARGMGSRWDNWRGTAAGKPIRDMKMTIHGLRATAVCDRRLRGITHQAISNELCMSLAQVMHYSRFIDQPALARASRDQREHASNVTIANFRIGAGNS